MCTYFFSSFFLFCQSTIALNSKRNEKAGQTLSLYIRLFFWVYSSQPDKCFFFFVGVYTIVILKQNLYGSLWNLFRIFFLPRCKYVFFFPSFVVYAASQCQFWNSKKWTRMNFISSTDDGIKRKKEFVWKNTIGTL